MFTRKQVFKGAGNESLFLWGARQTGKSTLLKSLFPNAIWFDLLKSDIYRRYQANPAQFRETILASETNNIIIVDEVQKIPELLDEIHWLIVNHSFQFDTRSKQWFITKALFIRQSKKIDRCLYR